MRPHESETLSRAKKTLGRMRTWHVKRKLDVLINERRGVHYFDHAAWTILSMYKCKYRNRPPLHSRVHHERHIMKVLLHVSALIHMNPAHHMSTQNVRPLLQQYPVALGDHWPAGGTAVAFRGWLLLKSGVRT